MKAPQTAGIIHTDFERGFIRAEVIKYDDYVALGSEKACRDQGKIGVEGKEYDRLGLNDEYITILGVKVPSQTMPVRPGRNLAIIIEVAARNLSMKKLGFSAARELDRRMNEMIMKRSNPDAQNQG